MKYSFHAEERLIDRSITKAEVERIVATGTVYGPTAQRKIELRGLSDDNRPFCIVMNESRTIVVTIIDES